MSQVLDSKMKMEKGYMEKKGGKKWLGARQREMSTKSAFSPLIGRKHEEFI